MLRGIGRRGGGGGCGLGVPQVTRPDKLKMGTPLVPAGVASASGFDIRLIFVRVGATNTS